ncbi:PKD domain-containing protein [Brevibacterium samyangense]|uniref:PKD domain-containing protein n=1 Tax=Brevibacterium samyangense TaxID=366888 RepID=A0ABP5ETT3_9MICO
MQQLDTMCGIVNVPSTGEPVAYLCDPTEDGGPAPEPVVLPWITTTDFQSFDIPASDFHAVPASWAVTNRETGFYADGNTRYIDLELLGFPVQVRATPIRYEWDFGDGTTYSTTNTGGTPETVDEATITHSYTEPGPVTVRLTTVYSGMFSIAGGNWIIIEGTASVESEPLPLEVFRFHKYLVDENCLENPDGPDCG